MLFGCCYGSEFMQQLLIDFSWLLQIFCCNFVGIVSLKFAHFVDKASRLSNSVSMHSRVSLEHCIMLRSSFECVDWHACVRLLNVLAVADLLKEHWICSPPPSLEQM